jgi:hypothetical protein
VTDQSEQIEFYGPLFLHLSLGTFLSMVIFPGFLMIVGATIIWGYGGTAFAGGLWIMLVTIGALVDRTHR